MLEKFLRRDSIRKCWDKFVHTGGMCEGQKLGRPCRSVETVDRVLQGYLTSPRSERVMQAASLM
jgi:hypothetical protein